MRARLAALLAVLAAAPAVAQMPAPPAPQGAEACRASTAPCAIAPGIRYRQLLRTSPRRMVIHIAEVDLATPGVRVALAPADRSAGMEYRALTTRRFLAESGAHLAVNASYFLPFVGGSPAGQDFVPREGQGANASGAVIAGGQQVSPPDDIDARATSMACFRTGAAQIVEGQACPAGTTDGVAAGPRLIDKGVALPRPAFGPDGMFRGAVPPTLEQAEAAGRQPGNGPRTALGVSADGRRLWLVVVDGRQPDWSEGATHEELVALFHELGATDAMSLDGGGSATMGAAGAAGPFLLSRPIHTRVPGRERPVANHIAVFSGEPAPRRPTAWLGETLAPEVQALTAKLVRMFDAPEARQGVAVDERHFYAVVNSAIGKYDKQSGRLMARWAQPRGGAIRHLNSCRVLAARLLCANSNHPEVPMASSVEWFDTATLAPVSSHSLGLMDEGSLTFVEPWGKGWLAGFAHYSDETGSGFKDARYSAIASFDDQWRRTGGWVIPPTIRARMAPQGASGGAIGPDGLLYLFGHDRPELYVMARPLMGPELVHLATIEVDAAGQAFAFDPSSPRRIFTIDRPTATVRVFDLPPVALELGNARPF